MNRLLKVAAQRHRLWTPAQMGSALRGWWPAKSITGLSDGAAIPSLASSGGVTNTLAQGTAGKRPVYGHVSSDPDLPCMDFDGVDDALIMSDRTISNGGSCIVVACLVKFDAFATDTSPKGILTIPTNGAGSTRHSFGLEGIAGASKRFSYSGKATDAGGTVNQPFTTAAAADTSMHVLVAQFNRGVNPSRSKFWIDGVLGFDANSSIAGGTWDATDAGSVSDGVCIGNKFSYATNQGMDAKLLDFVISDAVISDAVRQKVEGYMAWSGKIQANLPVGHPYLSAPPYI